MGGKTHPELLDRLLARLESDLARSPFAAALRDLAGAPDRLIKGRALTPAEKSLLIDHANTCDDWDRVRLGSGTGLEAVSHTAFAGDVLLEGFRGECPVPGGSPRPAGLFHCRVRDAIIGNASLYRVDSLERQVVADGAVLEGIGEIDCPAPSLFGLGLAIHPGAETGSRTLWLSDTASLEACMEALGLAAPFQAAYQARLDQALAPLRCRFGYVGEGAKVAQTRRVLAAWIGPGSQVAGASLIRESALLSRPDRPCEVTDEAWVENSLLQAGSRVGSGGKVSRSLLLGRSAVAWGGMVSQSVVGAETHIHKGEVTASVVGPLVGLHHQSLLISALWPEGRGNIAYGANVGSNHTGKKPDQEIRPGEGNFFGLGCSIKFPANFDEAPYSLIATGVATPPQRLAFPFSLINQPAPPAPPGTTGLNEIAPGWMWSENVYALARRSYKSEDADPEGNPDGGGFFHGRLFTPSLAAKVLRARQALDQVRGDKPFYLDSDLPGLGKNFLRQEGLAKARAAYDGYLAVYLFRTFAHQLPAAFSPETRDLVEAIGPMVGADADWKGFLASKRGRLSALERSLPASLARDDRRGRHIFPDYDDFLAPPEQDATLLRFHRDALDLDRKLDSVVQAL